MYYTEKEVKELLEQAFAEGYDDGIDDTLDYIDENYELEDGGFDLMDEYEAYTETIDPEDKESFRKYKIGEKAKKALGKSAGSDYIRASIGRLSSNPKVRARSYDYVARSTNAFNDKVKKSEDNMVRGKELLDKGNYKGAKLISKSYNFVKNANKLTKATDKFNDEQEKRKLKPIVKSGRPDYD